MTIDNPLYKFKVPTDKTMGAYGVGLLKFPDGDEFLECYATGRCPTREERDPKGKAWKDGVVYEETANALMTKHSAVNDVDYGTAAELVWLPGRQPTVARSHTLTKSEYNQHYGPGALMVKWFDLGDNPRGPELTSPSFCPVTCSIQSAVSAGGSIILQSASMNLAIPKRETATGISLLCLDASIDSSSSVAHHDEENYNVLLSMLIRSNKPAGRGYGQLTELEPRPWFAGENTRLHVDVGADAFTVYVAGREIGAVPRAIKGKDVTHVRYWTMPANAAPRHGDDVPTDKLGSLNLL
ncbi:hypothetical protein F5X96DRAFT_668824 [Biscogniauxia mediterranea]|nr:hypothetical protein F5X96DRAFT_668824 [Biscogniauxia mediterranea]